MASGDLTFSYDAQGRLNTAVAPAATRVYSYDGALPTGTTWSTGSLEA